MDMFQYLPAPGCDYALELPSFKAPVFIPLYPFYSFIRFFTDY